MKTTTKQLVLCALFAALTAVLAQIQIPIGPVPFNLAVLGAFLAGMLLSPVWAACSMGVYMAMGLIGIPVFASFQGGPAALFGKTGGYVVGYIAIAVLTAFSLRISKNIFARGAIMGAGVIICYAFGTIWFMTVTGADLAQSLAWCVIPFIIPDIAKGVLGYSLGIILQKRLAKAGLIKNSEGV